MLSSRIDPILDVLRRDGVVILPTDTLYGLAGRLRPQVLAGIYRLKNRDNTKPLAILVNGLEQLQQLCEVTGPQKELASRLLPGAVTCIFNGREELAALHPAYADSLAVRWLDLAPVNRLLQALGEPLLLTSANISGDTDPTILSQVEDSLLQAVDCICFPGLAIRGRASALVDLRETPPRVSRSNLTLEQLLHD